MTKELKGLIAGLAAGLGVVGAAYGISAVASKGSSADTKAAEAQPGAKQAAPAAGQLVSSGRTLYLQACAGCHGQDAQGRIGPTLHHLGDPDAKIALSIKNGFQGKMPGFGDKYDDAQIKALVAYIQSLN